jgi:hypothetical protein
MSARPERPLPAAASLAGLGVAALLGVVGVGLAGRDPIALLAWLALLALPAGVLAGGLGARLWPYGAAVPGAWAVLLVWCDAASARDLPAPAPAALVPAGLFFLGLGFGACFRARPFAAAGAAALVVALFTVLPLAGGLAEPGAARGREALNVRLLDLSPVAPAFDAAGWDWTHANPFVYRTAGVEWVPRQPYRGNLASVVLLVVGCASGLVLPRLVARDRGSSGVAGPAPPTSASP